MPRDGSTAVRTETARPPSGLNWVLQRQLNEARRANGDLDHDAFLAIVSRHYDLLDEERSGVVRSMRMLSEEAQALARETLAQYQAFGLNVAPFELAHASQAIDANLHHGKGMGQGGKLNLLDLMVYAVARARGEPVLCTGRDFAATDLVLHPASRAG